MSQDIRQPLDRQQTNQFVRDFLHHAEAPPPVAARFYYTSALAIDDPLSPLPPPLTASSAPVKQPPRPFSAYDNDNLEQAWLKLRKEVLKWNEEEAGEKKKKKPNGGSVGSNAGVVSNKQRTGSKSTVQVPSRRGEVGMEGQIRSGPVIQTGRQRTSSQAAGEPGSLPEMIGGGYGTSLTGSLRVLDAADIDTSSTTTGTPFIRAASRTNIASSSRQTRTEAFRPAPHALDSYNWDDDTAPGEEDERPGTSQGEQLEYAGPTAKVPVGVSRLHNVVMPQLQLEPIYWSPVHDIADVVRATWFYKDTMIPVEVNVANMLEAGYIELQPWSETWKDELNSACEVGAEGEVRILHPLWPENPKKFISRPSTSTVADTDISAINFPESVSEDPDQQREEVAAVAGDLIDIASGPEADNKAAGTAPFGRDGTKRIYLNAAVIYANDKEAYILRPSLQPSAYYGRRPLANYIRKGRNIGVSVVRGFDQKAWDKLHPPKKGITMARAQEGVSSSQAGAPPGRRQKRDAELAKSERPEVTDLVLVIHGIGQKLSERMESFHFTHAINAFRREVNVELGTDVVKAQLKKDMGGVMVLPVNWRLSLSFEDGGYRDEETADPSTNTYTLKDITPESLPSVRNIISDVMLDVPYYLSSEHNPKMIAACIREANRIYRLWCANNPGFENYGRVHLLAHSLGSVMAVDILSSQPTHMPPELGNPKTKDEELPTDHFIFDTRNLFLCGSPAGFFLLLKKATLLPRRGRHKPGAESEDDPNIAGEKGTYGCLALDNLYNVVNPYDPVTYRMNAIVDSTYSASLKPALVPSAQKPLFLNPFRSSSSTHANAGRAESGPKLPRLPSNVELETHNFTREEIAERRAYLLNDNGQIDYFLRYGGGPLEIQYLTMLGAHSSYWISRDFVRMIVVEVGRKEGREGTLLGMRAVKKKGVAGGG